MKWAWYNEIDAQKAAWLRELMCAGVIAPGEVDERSIADVEPSDLRGFAQCHFFAGIGVWSYALRLAGWPDDRPVWTGSCPCPSFSCAGKGEGFSDPRHLWPEWFRLIRECRPRNIFGEQVAAAIRHGWLDVVCRDLEAEGYAIAPAVLGAHSVGAPHIRQRLYFCAHSEHSERRPEQQEHSNADMSSTARFGEFSGPRTNQERLRPGSSSAGKSLDGRNSSSARLQEQPSQTGVLCEKMESSARESANRTGATRGFWADCDWWHGRDEKFRPIEPGLFPLAHGATNRVLKLRGFGDAVVPQVAAEFIKAFVAKPTPISR